MKKTLGIFLISAGLAVNAWAQTAPFDMSGERPVDAPVVTPPAPLPSTQPTPNTQPDVVQPSGKPSSPPLERPQNSNPPAAPVTGADVSQPVRPSSASSPTASQPPASDSNSTQNGSAQVEDEVRRYIIPNDEMELKGEYDRKSWSIYLTPAQAAAPAKLKFAYQNSIVTAPETSQISIFINNRLIGKPQVSSPDNVTQISFDIPAGTLQAGANLLNLTMSLRHRTDCNVESTYDLWVSLDPAQTYLAFENLDDSALSTTDAIRSVGSDARGETHFNLVVPALYQSTVAPSLLRLTQGISVLSGMPNQKYTFQLNGLPKPEDGHLTVMVGTFDELKAIAPDLPPVSGTDAFVSVFKTDQMKMPILVVSGPSWDVISPAIDGLVSVTDRPVAIQRTAISTHQWSSPDAPLFFSRKSTALTEMGVETTGFSGRRFKTGFNIAVPADFYADAYGEAQILLDAVYTSDVLPGSHIDVYVNDNIASTVPITSSSGGEFVHFPIRVTMRHFKPGVNSIAIEAILKTQKDSVCAAGTPSSPDIRFVLAGSSELYMPDFARVGQRPNLAALAGTGYPYSRADQPVPLYIDRVDADILSAAATFLGKISLHAGRPIPLAVTASPTVMNDQNAIFLGAIAQLPQSVLTQVNISLDSQTSWSLNPDISSKEAKANNALDDIRTKIREDRWFDISSSVQGWFKRNFDISLSSLRVVSYGNEIFAPSNDVNIMIAQGINPQGNGSWTIITSPSGSELENGVSTITSADMWPDLMGRVSTYNRKLETVDIVAANSIGFAAPPSWSILNLRLIVTNWLSGNILSYALFLLVFVVLSGIATASLLSRVGRNK